MKYRANFKVGDKRERADAEIVIEEEGILLGGAFVDYARIRNLRPISHRVFLDLAEGYSVEISMLGFSFDGFWEELLQAFGKRSLDSLFVEEPIVMDCEGEYAFRPTESRDVESGRGRILLTRDAVCILPQTSHAVRIPLCFAKELQKDGYLMRLELVTGEAYAFGRMGYDTNPFADRCRKFLAAAKKERESRVSALETKPPFTERGIFRTYQDDGYWLAAFGDGRCAVELFTDEQTATYLYTFRDREAFAFSLEMAMEAMGTHREIIFQDEEQLSEKPLYLMSVHRSPAVRFLRGCSAGRIIHTASHGQKLAEFLG